MREIAAEVVQIYPNPMKDFSTVSVESTAGQEIQWQLVDLAGVGRANGAFSTTTNGTAQFTLDRSTLEDGAYLLLVQIGKNRYQKVLMVK